MPPRRDADWGHEFVRSHFVGQLINRHKLYSANLRTVLEQNRALRQTADYKPDNVTESRAVRRARELMTAVKEQQSKKEVKGDDIGETA